nr:hypothetical protein [Butyricimonas synergistica]
MERTFVWFDHDRRLSRNYELTFDMVKIADIKLLIQKI